MRIFFLGEVSPHWDPRTQAYWPIALYFSFKFIGCCLEAQPPYRGSRSRSASPLLFVPDPSWQKTRAASLLFPTLGIRIGCVPIFSFLHRISCMRESLLSLWLPDLLLTEPSAFLYSLLQAVTLYHWLLGLQLLLSCQCRL